MTRQFIAWFLFLSYFILLLLIVFFMNTYRLMQYNLRKYVKFYVRKHIAKIKRRRFRIKARHLLFKLGTVVEVEYPLKFIFFLFVFFTWILTLFD